jgi:hypothetical protein
MCDKYAASFVASAGTSSFTASGVNLHHGEIEDAAIRAVIQDGNEIKLQVDVVGLDLTALIDTRQVVE